MLSLVLVLELVSGIGRGLGRAIGIRVRVAIDVGIGMGARVGPPEIFAAEATEKSHLNEALVGEPGFLHVSYLLVGD